MVPGTFGSTFAQIQDIGIPQHSGGLMDGWKLSITEDGALADVFRVNDADMNLAILPDEISLEAGVMLCDMVTTGFHGAELAEIEYGDSAAVLGIGAVGQIAIAAAKLCTIKGPLQTVPLWHQII